MGRACDEFGNLLPEMLCPHERHVGSCSDCTYLDHAKECEELRAQLAAETARANDAEAEAVRRLGAWKTSEHERTERYHAALITAEEALADIEAQRLHPVDVKRISLTTLAAVRAALGKEGGGW